MLSLHSLLPVGSLVLLFAARLGELGAKRSVVRGVVEEVWTLRLFILAGVVMVSGTVAEYLWRGGGIVWWSFTAGWGFAIASFLLRRQAIRELGAYWSLHVEFRENQPLVRSGPFAWMRHPTYFSMILELLAGALLLHAVSGLLLSLVIFIPALWRRIHLEEMRLQEKYGEEFRSYQKATPMLFPYRCLTR